MCDRWRDSYENFFEDMGPRPGKNYTLDRIDANGNYQPDNCRWATRREQANNKRCSILIEIGPSLVVTLAELADMTELPYATLFHRHKYRAQHPIMAVCELYEKRGLCLRT